MENWSYKLLGGLLLLIPACGKPLVEIPAEPLVFQADCEAFRIQTQTCAGHPIPVSDAHGKTAYRIRSHSAPIEPHSKTGILSSLYEGVLLTCTQGPEGAENAVWSNLLIQRNGSGWSCGKIWPEEDPSWHFYASNRPLALSSGEVTVDAGAGDDVVCACLVSPAFQGSNTLTFKHIFGRIGTVSVSSPYTVSDFHMSLVPKTGGVYRLRNGEWLSTTSGTPVSIAPSGPGSQDNDLWLVPGDYLCTVSFQLTRNLYTWNCNWMAVIPVSAGRTLTLEVLADDLDDNTSPDDWQYKG